MENFVRLGVEHQIAEKLGFSKLEAPGLRKIVESCPVQKP